MPLEFLDLSLVFLIIIAASLLQGAVGFGAGLIAIPSLVIAGYSLPQAMMITMITALAHTGWSSYKLRHDLVLKDTRRPIVLRLLAIPIGTAALWLTTDMLNPREVKQIIGVILIFLVAMQWLLKVEPQERLHSGWEFLAFLFAGTMIGYCGMGGPPIVLWVMAHRWSNARSRAFLFFVAFTGLLPQLLLHLYVFENMQSAAIIGLLAIPFSWLGIIGGLRIGANLPKTRLRKLSYILIILIALFAIAQPWIFPN